jgi:hypothetical protein
MASLYEPAGGAVLLYFYSWPAVLGGVVAAGFF